MNFLERIEDYIENKLSLKERQLFEEELKDNETLRKATEDFQLDSDLKEILFIDQARKELDQLEINSVGPKNNSFSIGKLLSIAAAILLISIVALFIFSNNNYSNKKLADTHYIIPNGTGTRSANDLELNKIEQLFVDGNWSALIEFTEQSQKTTPAIQYFYAHALLKDKKYDKAINVLKNLTNITFLFRDKCEYDLAIAYLNNDETNKCIQTLNKIIESDNHLYKEKSKRLLDSLNSRFRIFIL